MAGSWGIEVVGIKELRAALEAVDAGAAQALKTVFTNAATDVAADAARRVPVGPTGKARKSVKARGSAKHAEVVAGGKRVPYYPWLDFGGAVGRSRSVKRHVIKGGRFLYPAFSARRASVNAELERALTELARTAGLL